MKGRSKAAVTISPNRKEDIAMMFYHNFRIHHLLVALLLLAGCDSLGSSDSVDNNNNVSKTPDNAPLFSGPDVAVFTAGSTQSVDYYAEQPQGREIDVTLVQFPAGSAYAITDLDGGSKKKISITWNPGYGTAGSMHPVSMLARVKDDGSESLGSFDIYVDGN